MNMKKWLCAIVAMLLALGSLALAEDGDLQAQLDAANARIAQLEAEVELYKPYYEKQIVAEYGEDGVIWRDDAMAQYEQAASMYSQYGLNIDDYADNIKQQILETLVRDAVLDTKAAELGFTDLDDATRADLEKQANDTYENYIEMYKGYFSDEDATDEEAREATIAQLDAYGMSYDSLLQELTDSYIDEQLMNSVTAGITVSDEEIHAAYDDMVAQGETDYADDYSYNSARTNGRPIAWNPEGYRAVKHVLIRFDDEQAQQYDDLQDTLDSLNAELEALDAPADEAAGADDAEETDEAPEAEPRAREDIQADIGRVAAEIEALYSQLLPEAEEVIEAFEAGEDFDALIEKYGQDPGMQGEPAASIGYAVSADSSYWDPAFTEGAMGIEAIGGISGPIYGRNGIHVIYYMADITPGAVPFEDIAADAEAAALDSKSSETYSQQVSAWVEEAAPVYHADRF